MAPVPPQTLLSLASHPVPSTSTVSLLPFTLAHDGPARISTFFHPRPYPSAAAKDQEGATTTTPVHRQAAFRGRRIVSSTLSLPEGYRGLVYSTTAPLPPSATEIDSTEVDGEVEERAAKRAKRAAASAAALDKPAAAVEDDQAEQADADLSRRRSPRKSTSAASTRARERAIRLAKEKARRKSAAAGTLQKKGFSLDSDEEDQAGDENLAPAALEADEKASEPVPASENEAPAPTTSKLEEAAVIEASETPVLPQAESLVEGALDEGALATATVPVGTEDAAAAVAAPLPTPAPPLRTISTVSVASSSIITSAPRSPSPPPLSSTAKAEFDSAAAAAANLPVVSLSRDEKRLVPSLTFDSIEIWNPDWPLAGGKVTEDDEVGRAVFEWIGLANKIHAY
ncbi:hypothetical protein RHOSPDRAFT_32826 [Rhodotorula sp. JG-1b]|nr:hypothetical protein RHOSPDRAFT_32826 [Rhodotorula sp. JG-1b]